MSDALVGTQRNAGRKGAWLFPVLVILLGLVAAAPLLQPGYFWGAHDARHDVYFIFEYDRAVQDGIWLPGWGPDWAFGYGYPFWIVYGPLATLAGELLHHFLGFGFEASVKGVLGLSIVLSGLAMYGFVRSWLGKNAGLVAAVAYMVVPYHLVDLYVRSAMAETVALVFLPLALWGFRETVCRPRIGAVIGAAAAYAAIMWTSNLVAVVFTPALALYVIALLAWRVWDEASREGRRTLSGILRPALRGSAAPLAAIALGLGLSAAFFVPALLEQGNINQTQWFGEYYDPAQHFVYLHQLFNATWGFGISQPGPNDTAQGSLSYQMGAAPALLSLFALALAGGFDAGRRRELRLWGAWAAIAVFLTLGISAAAWSHLPIIPFAQFPWRYLMLAILPLSILPAALAARSAEEPAAGERLRWPGVVLAGLLLLSSYPYLKVEIREPTAEQGPVSYAALMRFQRTSDEMTGVTAWVDPERRPLWSSMADLWVQGRDVTTRVDYSTVPQNEILAVNAEGVGSQHEEIWYHAGEAGQQIIFNRFWYPGWTAYRLDAKGGKIIGELPVEREDGPLARIVVPVPQGEGYILLRFENTPLRTAAKAVSLITLTFIGILAIAWPAVKRKAQRR